MSTANKLTYLNVTKQKLKQAINNIGGEVTDETTFRNYVAELENAYDRLPKTEFEEGESVTLENTLKGKLDFDNGVVGIGQTEQDGTPTPDIPIAINSVTGNQDVVVKDGNNNTIATYQLSLGDIQLNAIGNYKDELVYDVENDKVYKNENVNEHIFTENENISLQSINSYGIANFFISHSLGSVSNFALCNYFTLQTSGISITQEEGFLWQHNGVYFRIKSSTASDVSSFKTWLNSHSVKVEYALTETSREEITDTTLINQVKALYNAHSLNGTTIIESNGNLPMIIKVRALKGE